MERYKNLSGKSGVSAFETGSDYIKVKFKDGLGYMYNNNSTGFQKINAMKILALNGMGLNTFINKNVRKKYLYKL